MKQLKRKRKGLNQIWAEFVKPYEIKIAFNLYGLFLIVIFALILWIILKSRV